MTAADILESFDFRQHNHLGHGTGSTIRLRLVSALTVVGLHIAAGYALLQVEAVRQVVEEAAPLFVEFIRPAVVPPKPPILPVTSRVLPKPKTQQLLAAAPIPDGTPPTVVEMPPPAPISPALEEPTVAAITTPPADPVPQPRLISGVKYVRPPRPEYPVLSRRMHEEGKVIVRVLINPEGRPEQALIQLSSGSSRLDQAASNAVLAALFKPHTENGMALHVYALIPITFELTQ